MALTTFTSGQVLTAAQMNAVQANDYNQTVSTKTASYTLVAADKGTRVVMNNASSTTITVNTSLFNAGDTLFIQNIGAGTCTITAGTATVSTTGSLALAQFGGGTLYFTSAGVSIFFLAGASTGYGIATGGSSSSINVGGINYTLLTFTSDGTLTVTKAGFFDFLIVGGGGAGGFSSGGSVPGGGGGAGAIMEASLSLAATTFSIDIGAGGAGTDPPTAGVMSGITASRSLQVIGGGPGGGRNGTPALYDAKNGGCGGGAGHGASSIGISLVPSVGGFAGGTGSTSAGGGGGVSAVGVNGSGATGGAGGAGFDVNAFTGSGSLFKGGGGGGGAQTTAGAGGSSVGGAGATSGNGTAASANTGSGGGGAGYNATGNGGAGGSGIVYVRFKV